MFPFLYETKRDREDWGDFFCGPEQLDQSKETLIARFPRTGGDGHDVEVYVCALPARCYSVRVLPRQPEQYHEECHHASARLDTGSGTEMAGLARRLAQEIAARQSSTMPPDTRRASRGAGMSATRPIPPTR